MSLSEKIKGIFKNEDITPDKKAEVLKEVETAISEIKESEATKEPKEKFDAQSFLDVPLSDGTMVMIEPAVEVGAAVTVAVDGEVVPVEDASHELADGTVIRTVGGVIEEVITPEGDVVAEEPMSEEPSQAPKQMPSPKSVIERTEIEKKYAAIKNENAELKEKVEALEKANKELDQKFSKAEKDNESKIEQIVEEVTKAVDTIMDFSVVQPTEAPRKASNTVSVLKSVKASLRNIKKK